jgi:hypothetical protein
VQQAALPCVSQRTRDVLGRGLPPRRADQPLEIAANMVIGAGYHGAKAMNQLLWYGSWLVFAAVLLGIVLAMFLQDLKRVSDEEPLRIPFIGEASPGDLTYPLALIELFGPYVTLGAAIAFFFGVGLYLSIFGS